MLIIGRTQLKGLLPSEIGKLTLLGKFPRLFPPVLGILHLSGSHKTFVLLNILIERLVLSHNSLKGMIPKEIGALTNLVQLNIGEQKLFGTIPSELFLLTALGKNRIIVHAVYFSSKFPCVLTRILSFDCNQIRLMLTTMTLQGHSCALILSNLVPSRAITARNKSVESWSESVGGLWTKQLPKAKLFIGKYACFCVYILKAT